MKQCDLTFKISSIAMLVINVISVVFFLVVLILSLLKVCVFGAFHFWLAVAVGALNITFVTYLAIKLIIANKKLDIE